MTSNAENAGKGGQQHQAVGGEAPVRAAEVRVLQQGSRGSQVEVRAHHSQLQGLQ